MAAPRRVAIGLAGAGALWLVACSPPPQPKTMPPQSVSEQSPDPPPPSDPAPSAPPRNDSVVVVDKGGEAEKPPSLADASRAEKERRQGMDKPAVVITDKNLAAYAANGQITTANPSGGGAAKPAAPTQNLKGGHDEGYWRNRGREIRQRWHDAVDERKQQQKNVERLRTAFYAEDDPYVRDGRIKPEWDRALEKLDQSRRDIDQAKKDLDVFTDEGLRAGAYQAWLEDGIDLEPVQEPVKPKPNESSEPKVLEPGNLEPPPHA